MRKRVAIVARPDAAAGFGLAGLPALETGDPAVTDRMLADLVGAEDVGVILLDDRTYRSLSDESRARFARRPVPLVVPFPGPAWERDVSAAEAYVVDLLRRAIGYRVKLL